MCGVCVNMYTCAACMYMVYVDMQMCGACVACLSMCICTVCMYGVCGYACVYGVCVCIYVCRHTVCA